LARLEQGGILGGVDLGRFDASLADRVLIAVTEQHTKEDLDRLVDAVRAASS
jgi:glycine dehydrogenase subunit 1